MTIGERIKLLRESRDWTQRDLAVAADMWPQDVARFESDKNMPRIEALTKLADALGVTLDELTGRVTATE